MSKLMWYVKRYGIVLLLIASTRPVYAADPNKEADKEAESPTIEQVLSILNHLLAIKPISEQISEHVWLAPVEALIKELKDTDHKKERILAALQPGFGKYNIFNDPKLLAQVEPYIDKIVKHHWALGEQLEKSIEAFKKDMKKEKNAADITIYRYYIDPLESLKTVDKGNENEILLSIVKRQ